MKTPQKTTDAFTLAEGALILAIQSVDNALGEAIGNDACATEFPDFVVAVMEFAGRIYAANRMGAPALH